MKDTEYNGWTNYETWAVNLWMTNDESSDTASRELAAECYADAEANQYSTREEVAILGLADRLRNEADEGNPCEESNNVYTDLMRAALSEVCWYEIAKSLMDDIEKEGETEEEEETA